MEEEKVEYFTAFLDIHFLDTMLVLGSFQHPSGKDSLYDGIYFSTTQEINEWFGHIFSDFSTSWWH